MQAMRQAGQAPCVFYSVKAVVQKVLSCDGWIGVLHSVYSHQDLPRPSC